jgi:hypothetical protein
MRSLRCLVSGHWSGRHPSARIDSLASGRRATDRHQLPQGAAAWHGCDEWDGSPVASYHNLRYCAQAREGFVYVGRAGRAEGWIMDGRIVVCK